jgi:hypothetical protein
MNNYDKVFELLMKAQYSDYKLTRKDLSLILDYVVKSRYGKEMKK